MRCFAHDASETGVPQPFFQAKQNRLLVAGFGVDDAVGMKSDAIQGRREEITASQAPENRTLESCEHARDEERGRSAMNGTAPGTRNFVQRAQGKSAFGQARVDRRSTKREHGMPLTARMLDAGDPVAQLLKHACRHERHQAPQVGDERCSYFVLISPAESRTPWSRSL